MQTKITTIKKNFQKSFEKYNSNAIIQKQVAEQLSDCIKNHHYNEVLEIGCGTGFLTKQLKNKITFNKYCANDLIEKSEIHIKNIIRDTEFYCGDFREINFNKKFDLIASNAVFQWFENIEEVFEYCKHILNKNGTLIFSTFSPNNFREIRELCGLSLSYKTADELNFLLEKNFNIEYIEQSEYIINFDNPLKIIEHMKNTGVNSLSEQIWSVKKIKEFCKEYSKNYPDLPLTYSPIIVVAKLK